MRKISFRSSLHSISTIMYKYIFMCVEKNQDGEAFISRVVFDLPLRVSMSVLPALFIRSAWFYPRNRGYDIFGALKFYHSCTI